MPLLVDSSSADGSGGTYGQALSAGGTTDGAGVDLCIGHDG